MKKIFCIIILLCFIFGMTVQRGVKGDTVQESIADKLIRFHVIANSDSVEDQTLKLQVRDKILEYITPRLKSARTIDESRELLLKNQEAVIEIAEKVIHDKGYTYGVTAALSHEYFPVKTYGNITLPQGKYEAFRVIIGSGEGQNWWCVMFPPLCFIDISKGNVSYSQTEKEMKTVLSDNEYKAVDNLDGLGSIDNKKRQNTERQQNKSVGHSSEPIKADNSGKIRIEFKIVNLLKEFIEQIQ